MKLTDIKKELDDIALRVVRGTRVSSGITVFDQTEFATAWLEGGAAGWAAAHRTYGLRPDDLPEALLAEGRMPFEDGVCVSQARQDQSVVTLMPGFYSPAFQREFFGAAMVMPYFGEMGGHRMTGLHEMGHYIADQLGLTPSTQEPHRDRARAEQLADGFAVAWAVATGADSRGAAEDVGTFRAVLAIHNESAGPAYWTFGMLDKAASIGVQARAAPDPVAVMRRLGEAVEKTLLPERVYAWAEDKDWATCKGAPELADVVGAIGRLANRQRSWKMVDEADWWAKLEKANPESFAALARLPSACFLAQVGLAAESDTELAWPFPPSAILCDPRLMRAAEAGAPSRPAALAACLGEDTSPQGVSAMYRAAAALFDGPLDQRLAADLNRLADHSARCRESFTHSKPVPLAQTEASKLTFVVVDARDPGFTYAAERALADSLSGAGVRAIAVVDKTPEEALRTGQRLRTLGDCARASVTVLTPEQLAEKRASIGQSAKAGQTMLVGALPELQAQRSKDLER